MTRAPLGRALPRRLARLTTAALLAASAACTPAAEGDVVPADAAAAAGATPTAAVQETAMRNQLTEQERADGWRLLFDGSSLAGWRGYRGADASQGWQALDGSLTRTAQAGDLVTDEQFENFELLVDWKVAPGGNSGIFYRGSEERNQIYFSAPEYQVLDDSGHVDGTNALTSAGAVYGLYPAPRGVVRPAGEWNTARLVVRGDSVEHWLNGTQMAAYVLDSDDWKARVAKSKFADWPEYGRTRRGHIGLQDHGDRVEFRNIKLREL